MMGSPGPFTDSVTDGHDEIVEEAPSPAFPVYCPASTYGLMNPSSWNFCTFSRDDLI